jgi:hypothetical protein
MEKSPRRFEIQSLRLYKTYFVRRLQKRNSRFRINNIYTKKLRLTRILMLYIKWLRQKETLLVKTGNIS